MASILFFSKFQITPSVAWNDDSEPIVDEKPLVQLQNDDTSKNEQFLAAGSAERTFFTVCGAKSSHKRHYKCDTEDDDDDDDESDDENVAQRRRLLSDENDAANSVRASIQVHASVVYFDQRSSAARTRKLVKTLFWAVFRD